MVGKVAEAFVGFYGLVGEHMISADSVRLEMHEPERHSVVFVSHFLCPLKGFTKVTGRRFHIYSRIKIPTMVRSSSFSKWNSSYPI